MIAHVVLLEKDGQIAFEEKVRGSTLSLKVGDEITYPEAGQTYTVTSIHYTVEKCHANRDPELTEVIRATAGGPPN